MLLTLDGVSGNTRPRRSHGNNRYVMEGFSIGAGTGLRDGCQRYFSQRRTSWRSSASASARSFGRLRQSGTSMAMTAQTPRHREPPPPTSMSRTWGGGAHGDAVAISHPSARACEWWCADRIFLKRQRSRMRVIAPLGPALRRSDHELLEPLRRKVESMKPDLLVSSGTSRSARSPTSSRGPPLSRLAAKPQVVVPGNHDIRSTTSSSVPRAAEQVQEYITSDSSRLIDAEIAVVGVNTARSASSRRGRINEDQWPRCGRRSASCRRRDDHRDAPPFDMRTIGTTSTCRGRARRWQ